MRVCVVGSGGREHALAVALARTAQVVVAPGNPGMAALSGGSITCTAQHPESIDADLFVVGPEAPLVDGLADRLRQRGQAVFGPGEDGARLEGSKAWMKQLLVEAGVPTAIHGTFDNVDAAVAFLHGLEGPYVVKTDGLAAGKGVLVTASLADAVEDVKAKLSGSAFGEAGRRVVIEEGLSGEELSVMVLCDGSRVVALDGAQDFKRIGEGDSGPNTGGMGSYSPVVKAGPALLDEVMDRAVEPTLAALRAAGIDYRGVLYAGLMLTPDGVKVLEYNVRFGDPETQVLLPRWQDDVAAVLLDAAKGSLSVETTRFSAQPAVCVVMAAPGYPLTPRTGDVIEGLDEAANMENVHVFAAGMAKDNRDRLVTCGGRVLGVTAVGRTLGAARAQAYRAVSSLDWPGAQYRRDIAERAAEVSA